MFKVTSALPSARAKLKIQNRKFVEVLHNNPIFFFVLFCFAAVTVPINASWFRLQCAVPLWHHNA